MNSRNFIIAVAVAISFFAACFAWETRGVLRGNGGKDVSVGSCGNGNSATIISYACQATLGRFCETSSSFRTIYFNCGYHMNVELNDDCTIEYSEGACNESHGHSLVIMENGSYVDDTNWGNCGKKTAYYCKTPKEPETVRIWHGNISSCTENCYEDVPVYPCHQSETVVPFLNCGTKNEVKNGC